MLLKSNIPRYLGVFNMSGFISTIGDLDNIFEPICGTTARANTGFVNGTTDIAQTYMSSSIPNLLSYYAGNTCLIYNESGTYKDLRLAFQPRGYAPGAYREWMATSGSGTFYNPSTLGVSYQVNLLNIMLVGGGGGGGGGSTGAGTGTAGAGGGGGGAGGSYLTTIEASSSFSWSVGNGGGGGGPTVGGGTGGSSCFSSLTGYVAAGGAGGASSNGWGGNAGGGGGFSGGGSGGNSGSGANSTGVGSGGSAAGGQSVNCTLTLYDATLSNYAYNNIGGSGSAGTGVTGCAGPGGGGGTGYGAGGGGGGGWGAYNCNTYTYWTGGGGGGGAGGYLTTATAGAAGTYVASGTGSGGAGAGGAVIVFY